MQAGYQTQRQWRWQLNCCMDCSRPGQLCMAARQAGSTTHTHGAWAYIMSCRVRLLQGNDQQGSYCVRWLVSSQQSSDALAGQWAASPLKKQVAGTRNAVLCDHCHQHAGQHSRSPHSTSAHSLAPEQHASTVHDAHSFAPEFAPDFAPTLKRVLQKSLLSTCGMGLG